MPAPRPLHAPLLPLPASAGARVDWTLPPHSGQGLALALAARHASGPLLVVTHDGASANALERELRFYAPELPVLPFPDWEILPYDVFSPHQDLISQRLATLVRLPSLRTGVVVVPVATLMQRVAPRSFLDANSLALAVGDPLDLEALRTRLVRAGYVHVNQVLEHGEFAVRGGLLDLFPMGSENPYRVELDDEVVASIRSFDAETQRSQAPLPGVSLLPGREFPVHEAALQTFYQRYLEVLEQNPARAPLYRDLQAGRLPPGIEFYLPLFFAGTETLLDYLPPGAVVAWQAGAHAQAQTFWASVRERFEERNLDRERPPLPPGLLYLDAAELFAAFKPLAQIVLQSAATTVAVQPPPDVGVDTHGAEPLGALEGFLAGYSGRVLLVAESAGRRETLAGLLQRRQLRAEPVADFASFVDGDARFAITVSPLDAGLTLANPAITVITERELYGERAIRQRRRDQRETDPETVIRNLAELAVGDAVVHADHGVGRFRGLEMLTVGGMAGEFLALEYADRAKIYVPVANLHLVHRYTGADSEHAPLHKLGSGQWERAQRKAREQVRDVAAELLELYAKRAAQDGHSYPTPADYPRFAAAFPYEETPDQARAIAEVLDDLAAQEPMDRVVCGDVGFGKTEVAMRAAFVVAHGGRQVAVLVPTTLLAEQHGESFRNRFADSAIRVEALSRFQSKREQDVVLDGLARGTVDVVIGTHRLLQKDVRFARLGLVIIDEEHRFGVQHKERMKALRAQVDVLTLTATPIPRTMSMAVAGLRGLSIIATPPPRRLAVKTFVRNWDPHLVREACQREFKRGGQVYVLHNRVETIERVARDLAVLVPEADMRVAHGQLPERELERIMRDFYHRRFNLLLCTTIIESGIDVPTANTIIIDRADRLGLAELHQLRGRVGRSHHQAYAYLMVPSRDALAGDALKRLEAIESLGELGIGFTLATHDMEIRGAGELLGESQHGHIQEVGFTLFHSLLERAVRDLKAGRTPDFDTLGEAPVDVELQIPALLPADYQPDIHVRLTLYKRIASAGSEDELEELRVEVIDRFGPLPEPGKNLFAVANLKLAARPIGIKFIKGDAETLTVGFHAQATPNVDALLGLIRNDPRTHRLDGRSTLKITRHAPAGADRLEHVRRILEKLTPRVPAKTA